MERAPLYQFENLTVEYRPRHGPAVHAVEGLDLTIGEGEFVALTGPSGSGKTSVLSAMEGLLEPSEGRVLFRGDDLYAMPEARQLRYRRECVGMVFQFFNLVPHMSALDNVMFAARIAGRPVDQARELASGLLDRVGLEKVARRDVAELSGGQQQRVAIARALVNSPAAVLADEPTGNLDRASKDLVLDLMCDLHAELGVALVVVTHDESVASRAGRVVGLG